MCIFCILSENRSGDYCCKTGLGGAKPGKLVGKFETGNTGCTGKSRVDAADIKAIGISYQMHGLVCVDKDQNVLRPAIIWCDSRAVPYGQKHLKHWEKKRASLIC